MTAPAGHVTVVVVKAFVPELHTVVTGPNGGGLTDGLAGFERDTDGEAGREGDTDGDAGGEGDTEGDSSPAEVHCTFRMKVVAAPQAPPVGAVSCVFGRMPHELSPKQDALTTLPLFGSAPTQVPTAKGPDGQLPDGLP